MANWAAALKGVLPGQRGEDSNAPADAGDEVSDNVGSASESLAPLVWLLGKVQSGKTSIIRAITAASEAEIGDGFRPCTRTSRLYVFPEPAPVMRFLDTRGLGEAGYDPAEDLAFSAGAAHVVLAVMRAMDTEQSALFQALRHVREQNPARPIVVAQTSLHEGYDHGDGHIVPYPFEPDAAQSAIARIPTDLMRSLAYQRATFDKLPGRGGLLFVPIDLTRPEDNLPPNDYGLDALTEALSIVAPAGMLAALSAMPGFKSDPRARSADPVVMGHAMAAAAGDLVPFPVAGTIAASTIQARMLAQLGRLYGIEWDKRAFAELSAAIGAGTLARVAAGIGLRQLAKLLPVYGQTAGAAASAAASFALTYALGKAAVSYLHGRRLGSLDRSAIANAYQQALRDAFRMAREQRSTRRGGEASP